MKRLALIIALCWPVAGAAQEASDADKSFLTELIEDNLSGDERQVSLIGFEGALSSEARIARLTVADSEGVWLTLEDVVLDWNRSALLRGAIDVTKLGAKRIVIARAPLPGRDLPSAEAQPFSLPDLPVSIDLGSLSIDRVELGPDFLGDPLAFQISGSARLAGGEGGAVLTAERLDGVPGSFEISGSFVNETKFLDLTLDLTEAPGGIAATLLDLPGAPAVALSVQGAAPLDAFAASLALATDGQDRVTGAFAIRTTATGSGFALDLGGDVTPLFDLAYRDFFGTDIRLKLAGGPRPDGGFLLSTLDLSAQTITLQGSLNIDAEGWPEKADLTGRIADPAGDPVLLPLAGPQTRLDHADLALQFDRALSDDWRTGLDIVALQRPGLAIDQISLTGGGAIRKDTGDVNVDLTYRAQGLTLDDAGAAQALGDEITGALLISAEAGQPVRIEKLSMEGPDLTVLADGEIRSDQERIEIETNILAEVESLGRFSTLAGRDLAGEAALSIISTVRPLDGIFDAIISAETADLRVGVPQVDPLLAGAGSLSALVGRDTAGTRLEALRVATEAATITADAALTSAGGAAEFVAKIADIGLIVPELSGLVQVEGTATQSPDQSITATVTARAPGAVVTVETEVNPTPDGQTVNGEVIASLADLATYQALANRPLEGRAEIAASGVLLADGQRFVLDVSANTVNLKTGTPQLDPLLVGRGQLSGRIARTGADQFDVQDLQLRFPRIEADANGSGSPSGEFAAQLSAILPQIGVVAPGLDGAAAIRARADRAADLTTAVTVDLAAPQTSLLVEGVLASPDDGLAFDGDINIAVASLAPYQSLIGQPVSGGVQADVSGLVRPDLTQLDLDLDIRTDDLGLGNPMADRLLRGTGTLTGQVARNGSDLQINRLEARTGNLEVTADLRGEGTTGSGQFSARLRDIGLFTDSLSGPVTAEGRAARSSNGWDLDVDAAGPGGIVAKTQGQVADSGTLDLTINGAAPLGLGNDLLAPRRLSGAATFDLALRGPAALSSVSGTIETQGARLAAPLLGQALDDISGSVTLDQGNALVDATSAVASGGTVSIAGPVGLSAPNVADLTATLRNVVLRDATLYETVVNGSVSVNGPLSGGALIAGRLALGQTEIRVPSSSIGTLGDLPNVTHIGASAAVRRTLSRADAATTPRQTTQRQGPIFPLDITVDAPARIFVRGRGVDAELGGQLTLGGDTGNIIPVGEFGLVRGRLDILQQRFELTEGSASLQGDFEPYLRLLAETEAATGTRISITVEGPASAPEVRFSSVPDLPQDEVLAQLIFGRNLSEISPLQAVQLAAAVATLAGRGGTGIIDSFRQNIGLDDFDVTTDEAGNAALRAGKYLSENLYTDVTVASDGSTEINLNLDITDEITAKGTAGADGETSIGIFFERDY